MLEDGGEGSRGRLRLDVHPVPLPATGNGRELGVVLGHGDRAGRPDKDDQRPDEQQRNHCPGRTPVVERPHAQLPSRGGVTHRLRRGTERLPSGPSPLPSAGLYRSESERAAGTRVGSWFRRPERGTGSVDEPPPDDGVPTRLAPSRSLRPANDHQGASRGDRQSQHPGRPHRPGTRIRREPVGRCQPRTWSAPSTRAHRRLGHQGTTTHSPQAERSCGSSEGGMIVGLTRCFTTFSSISTRPTSVRDGMSNIVFRRTSSRIARSPRAPVPRRIA